jgi:hypothetical protein
MPLVKNPALLRITFEMPSAGARKDPSRHFGAEQPDGLGLGAAIINGSGVGHTLAATMIENRLANRTYPRPGEYGLNVVTTIPLPNENAERLRWAVLEDGSAYYLSCDTAVPASGRLCKSRGNKLGSITYDYWFNETYLPRWRELHTNVASKLNSFLVR